MSSNFKNYSLYAAGGSFLHIPLEDAIPFNDPPFTLHPSTFVDGACIFSEMELQKNSQLPLSFVFSGGNSVEGSSVYSLFFFEDSESDWFILNGKSRVVFQQLFDEMQSVDQNRSRRMKRIVVGNGNCIVFEMMDGYLYLFKIIEKTLEPFFVEHISNVKCIGCGKMSVVIMVQILDGTIYKYEYLTGHKEIPFVLNNSHVKIFTGFCKDVQLMVLENNNFYVLKDSSTSKSAYGFNNVQTNTFVKIETPPAFTSVGIRKMDTGYSNCIVLLENGTVFARGLNNYNQCAERFCNSAVSIGTFEEISIIGSPVVDFTCGSVSVCFKTSSHFIFFGWVASKTFSETGFRKPIEAEDQDISLGPWHGLLYRNKFENRARRDLIYLLHNLRNFSTFQNRKYQDVTFDFALNP